MSSMFVGHVHGLLLYNTKKVLQLLMHFQKSGRCATKSKGRKPNKTWVKVVSFKVDQ